jgi:hypothetical protein
VIVDPAGPVDLDRFQRGVSESGQRLEPVLGEHRSTTLRLSNMPCRTITETGPPFFSGRPSQPIV